MNKESYNKLRWFLIYTKPDQEERAKENLENQEFETFLPMLESEKTKQPQSFSLKPMFPRYLFAKFNLENNSWTQIKSTRGVSHVIKFGDKLTEVPDPVVDFLKSKVDNNDVLKLQTKRKTFQKGDELVINQGVFQGKGATFLSMTSKERVRVLLSLMNRVTIAEISERNLEYKEVVETFSL